MRTFLLTLSLTWPLVMYAVAPQVTTTPAESQGTQKIDPEKVDVATIPPTPAPSLQSKTLKLDASDVETIRTLKDLLDVANDECSKLQAFQKYFAARLRVQKLIETKYDGYTLHESSLAVIPKIPPPARPK